MGKFQLSNLRELSTEEQLNLNGGFNLEASCSCGCSSCSCDKDSLSAKTDKTTKDVADGVKKALS